jgi:hypothetical protein
VGSFVEVHWAHMRQCLEVIYGPFGKPENANSGASNSAFRMQILSEFLKCKYNSGIEFKVTNVIKILFNFFSYIRAPGE